jgi:hypothetical protein
MRLTLERDLREQAERLLAELKAIEQWDTAYWRNRDPDVYETSAFLARESRRTEIILQIAVVRRSLLQMPAEEGKMCPYCEGKGYVLVEVLTHDGSTKTWARRDCPLCDGTGRLYGSTESGGSSAIAAILGVAEKQWQESVSKQLFLTRPLRA